MTTVPRYYRILRLNLSDWKKELYFNIFTKIIIKVVYIDGIAIEENSFRIKLYLYFFLWHMKRDIAFDISGYIYTILYILIFIKFF